MGAELAEEWTVEEKIPIKAPAAPKKEEPKKEEPKREEPKKDEPSKEVMKLKEKATSLFKQKKFSEAKDV